MEDEKTWESEGEERSRHVRRFAGLPLAALLLGLAGAGPGPARADEVLPPATREVMAELVGALALGLPLGADPAGLVTRQEREELGAALRTLAAAADTLARHPGRSEGFLRLGEMLARDAREALRRHRAGRIGEAGYLLQRLAENCIACHDRLPDASGSALGRRLVERMEGVATGGLGPPQRARLQIATRRFEAALDTYESLFASPETTPAQLDRMGYLADYLVVVLRVAKDPARARATLSRLRDRNDVPGWLHHDLGVWSDALAPPVEALAPGAVDPAVPSPTLAQARRLLARGAALRRVPADHTGLVHDVLASSLLYRLVEESPVAEAYYLLGVAEARIDRSYWLSPADLYLESAIRLAPEAPFAREAYALLERRIREGYTGSGGTHVPEEVKQNLEVLRRRIETRSEAGPSEGEPSDAGSPAGDPPDAGPSDPARREEGHDAQGALGRSATGA